MFNARDEPSNDRGVPKDPLYSERVSFRIGRRSAAEALFLPRIPGMEHLWSPAGATGGNQSQMGGRRKRLK